MKMIFTLLVLSFISHGVFAQSTDADSKRKALRGLRALDVVIEKLDPEIEAEGLSRSLVQTDVELRLRKAGLRVLSKGDDKTSSMAFLHIAVNTIRVGKVGVYAIAIEVSINEFVTIDRNKESLIVATWKDASYGWSGKERLRSLKDDVGDKVDSFLNDWLAANQK